MRARLAGFILALAAFPALAEEPPKCRLVRIAEWPVRFVGRLPIIDGEINGKKIGVLLDTGAYASIVMKDAADRLDLSTHSTSEWMIGVGGESRIYNTRIDEFRIGPAVRKGMRVRVGGERPLRGVDFILGDDFFRDLDLEFDYAKGVVRLFEPQNCKGAFIGYWDAKALRVPMEDEKQIVLKVKVNGREARAMLDSGASTSVVSVGLAAKVGITPQTPGVMPSNCSTGLGAGIVRSWVARFDTVAIGEEVIRDPRLQFSEFRPEAGYWTIALPDMLIGTDFLRTHRVLVSRSQRMVYFSYTGGLVFPATPTLDCEDSMKIRNPGEALAEFEQAIARNPNDAKALLNRALLRLRDKDPQGALVDLDAVIRLEPGNAVALQTRAGVRAAMKDYDGALADADAAIANGMRTAQMYLYRGALRRSKGDFEGVIAEYDEAIKIEPHSADTLRGRGRYLFHAGRFEGAAADFAASFAAKRDEFTAIWLALSRSRLGLDSGPVLEQSLTRLKGGEWPAPILQFLLGRIDRDALMSAAANPDEKKRKGQECEARFYLAEKLIGEGRAGEARPLLEAVRDECPRDYIEYDSTWVELPKLPR